MIADIHTHRLDAADAVISVNPWEFVLTEGKLYSVGIHPWQLGWADEGCFMQVEALVSCDNVVMVGECGIDKLRGGDISRQTEVAEWHAVLAERVGKPLVLHCVRASNELCRLRRLLQPSMPWILHGFRGNARVARQLLDAGFFISYGERFNPDAVNITPADRLLVETDESRLPVGEIYARLAECRHQTLDEFSSAVASLMAQLLPSR